MKVHFYTAKSNNKFNFKAICQEEKIDFANKEYCLNERRLRGHLHWYFRPTNGTTSVDRVTCLSCIEQLVLKKQKEIDKLIVNKWRILSGLSSDSENADSAIDQRTDDAGGEPVDQDREGKKVR